MSLLHDEGQHAEADERRQQRRQCSLDRDHRRPERHREHQEGDADDVQQEPGRVREDPVPDVGERGVRPGDVRVRGRAGQRSRDHRVPQQRDEVVGLRVLRLVLAVGVDDRDGRQRRSSSCCRSACRPARGPERLFSAVSSFVAAAWSDCMSMTTGIGSVKPGPEPAREQVVRLPGRLVLRRRARVGEAEPDRQDRRREQQQDDEHDRQHDLRVTGDEASPGRDRRARLPLARLVDGPQSQAAAVDLASEQRENRRQQRVGEQAPR